MKEVILLETKVYFLRGILECVLPVFNLNVQLRPSFNSISVGYLDALSSGL